MGWSFYNRTLTAAQAMERVRDLCTGDCGTYRHEPVAVSRVGSTYYAAVRFSGEIGDVFPCYEREPDGSVVVGHVFLTSNSRRDGWGYKSMDEGAGPYHVAAPLKIVDALTPLKHLPETVTGYSAHKSAHEWRDACRAYAAAPKARSLKEGDVIRLPQPVRFTTGFEAQTFRVSSYSRRGQTRRCYIALPSGAAVRLTQRDIRGFTKLLGNWSLADHAA